MKRFVWRKILVSAAILSASAVLVGSSVGFVREVSPQAAPLAEPLSLRIITIQTGNTIQVNCVGTLALSGNLLSCVALTPTPTEVLSVTSTVSPTSTGDAISPTASPSPTVSTRTPSPTPVLSTTPTSTVSPTSGVPPTATSTPGTGLTWYVSPNGSGGDGKSWGTAWKELNTINWTSVAPGNKVELDGGTTGCGGPYQASTSPPYDLLQKPISCGMIYHTSLSLSKSGLPGAPIVIERSRDLGHDGTVVLFGGRTTSLPYCGQASYVYQTSGVLSVGISFLAGVHDVVLDGTKRSGIIVYGIDGPGINFSNSNPGPVTMRNIEIFDTGTASLGANGWQTDNPNVYLAGHDLTFDRDLFHDAGQDNLQSRTITSPLLRISITTSWLYTSRENPSQPGYGFQTGVGEACTHPDAVQYWNGGANDGLTVTDSVIGPYEGQGIYPADSSGAARTNNVTIRNDLFLGIAYDRMNGDGLSVSNWKVDQVTSQELAAPDGTNGAHLDSIPGAGHSITNSILQGSANSALPGWTGSGNVTYQTDRVPGDTVVNPLFSRTVTATRPHWTDFLAADLTANCLACVGKGSTLHHVDDVLALIDAANGAP